MSDLIPPGFLLCGFLKNTVYSNHPHTLEQLHINIQRTVESISSGTFKKRCWITRFVVYAYTQTIMVNTAKSF